MNKYFSILFCFHSNTTDIYYNGLSIGNIRNGLFTVHKFKNVDGSVRDLTMQDLSNPCEFTTIEEFKDKVVEAVRKISIATPNLEVIV